jgi:hypothetical protein
MTKSMYCTQEQAVETAHRTIRTALLQLSDWCRNAVDVGEDTALVNAATEIVTHCDGDLGFLRENGVPALAGGMDDGCNCAYQH